MTPVTQGQAGLGFEPSELDSIQGPSCSHLTILPPFNSTSAFCAAFKQAGFPSPSKTQLCCPLYLAALPPPHTIVLFLPSFFLPTTIANHSSIPFASTASASLSNLSKSSFCSDYTVESTLWKAARQVLPHSIQRVLSIPLELNLKIPQLSSFNVTSPLHFSPFLSFYLTQGYQAHFHRRPHQHQHRGCLQRAEGHFRPV